MLQASLLSLCICGIGENPDPSSMNACRSSVFNHGNPRHRFAPQGGIAEHLLEHGITSSMPLGKECCSPTVPPRSGCTELKKESEAAEILKELPAELMASMYKNTSSGTLRIGMPRAYWPSNGLAEEDDPQEQTISESRKEKSITSVLITQRNITK
jgi:hypothetical protein